MSKVAKIAAIVVGVAAIIVTGGAALGLIPAVIPGLAITTATLGTILSVTATALSLVAGVLAKKPKLSSAAGGQQLEWRADPAAGEPYAVGETMVGASIVHQASWGDKNKFLGIVGVLSVCTISAYLGLYADMTQVTFSGRNATGYYANFMYLSTQLGAMPEATALDMTAPGGSMMPDWGSAYKTSGLATAGLVLVADVDNGKVYSGGTPKLTNKIRGVKAYDARADSTQSGGSGTQRANDETTYVYSDNPWVHAGTYALGRFQNDVRVIGPGLAPAQVDFPAFMEAANIADANGWKASGLCYSTDNKWDVLKAMAQAGGGYPMPTGAHLSCLVNAPKVSLETITEADVRGAVSAPQMLTRRQRLNGAIPRIRSSDHGWEVVPLDAVRSSAYLAADGGVEKTREIEFAFVADIGDGAGKDQAAQLAAYEVANSRERSPISVELGYVWAQLKLGDCVTLDLPSARLNSQKCVVIGRMINVTRNTVTLMFRTETDAKHTWALGVTGAVSTPPTVVQAPGTGDTGSSVSGIGDPPQRLSFRYDYTGAAESGEFPRDLTFKLNDASGNPITSGVTWSYLVTSGTLNGFTNASGSQSMSGTGTGTLTASSLGSSEAKAQVTALYNGHTYLKTVTLTQATASAPITGGTGGGSGGTLVSKTSGFSPFNSTTFTDITGTLTGTMPAGVTTADINVQLDTSAQPTTTGLWTVECRVMRDISGTWTQIGSTQTSGSNWNATDVSGEPAHFSFSISDTGLTAGSTYDWRVEMRLQSGTRNHAGVGTVTVTA
jgi:hypothetical protein